MSTVPTAPPPATTRTAPRPTATRTAPPPTATPAGRPAMAHRWHRLAGPVSVAVAAAGSLAVVGAVDPNEPGHYPTCPLLAVTGLYCPGCGSLRALHALVQGDVATAVDRNVLLVLALPLVVLAWVRWAARAAGLRPAPRRVLPPRVLYALAAGMVLYGAARNLPGLEWLAP